jgi:hypothetical protein
MMKGKVFPLRVAIQATQSCSQLQRRGPGKRFRLAEPDSRQLALAEAPSVCLHQEEKLRLPSQTSRIVLDPHLTLKLLGIHLNGPGVGWGRSEAEYRNPIIQAEGL